MKGKLLLMCLYFSFFGYAQNWEQIGNKIVGEAEEDQSGFSTSLSSDGKIVAVGARLNDGINGNDSGHIRVYSFNDVTSNWEQLGSDIDGEDKGDQLGFSIDLSSDGKILAAGAIDNNDSGHVRVYLFNDMTNSWEQLGSDIDSVSDGEFGYSISLSSDGKTLAVGAPYESENDSGYVRVYKFNELNSSWEQLGLYIDGEYAGDQSGFSVSLSDDGNILAIGAPKNRSQLSTIEEVQKGQVRIYKFNNDIGIWEQLGSDINGENAEDESGSSVSLSADGFTLAIGAIKNDDNGASSGQVRIYKFNNVISNWEKLGNDIDGENNSEQSGWSISLSANGKIVAIGARLYRGNSLISNGIARVYKYNSDIFTWEKISSDFVGESDYDEFGYSVSLSADGNTVVVGAREYVYSEFGGYVKVYEFIDTTLSLNDNVLSIEAFQVFPNPTAEALKVNAPGVTIQKVLIYDLQGALVLEKEYNNTNVSVPVIDLAVGTYLVNIKTDKGQVSRQFIKE